MGSNPKPVVKVVKNTGRKRKQPVWVAVCRRVHSGWLCLSSLKVSINTILLFTMIPASATIPTPVMIALKGWPVRMRPNSTPTVDITTDDSTKKV